MCGVRSLIQKCCNFGIFYCLTTRPSYIFYQKGEHGPSKASFPGRRPIDDTEAENLNSKAPDPECVNKLP
jgi:hypothetical protein